MKFAEFGFVNFVRGEKDHSLRPLHLKKPFADYLMSKFASEDFQLSRSIRERNFDIDFAVDLTLAPAILVRVLRLKLSMLKLNCDLNFLRPATAKNFVASFRSSVPVPAKKLKVSAFRFLPARFASKNFLLLRLKF